MSVEQAKQLIASHPLLMISKSWCPDCVYGKKVFADLHTEPYVVELDKMDEGKELQEAFLQLTNQNTVPNVFINGKHIGTENDIARLLESGELKKLVEDNNLVKN